MRKFTLISLGIISTLVVVGIFVAFNLKDNNDSTKEESTHENVEEKQKAGTNKHTAQGKTDKDQLEGYKKQGLNPFGDKINQDSLTDYDFREYIHGMTHQKIIADKKWGFYELLPERVDWLLVALDNSEGLTNETEYKEILEKWKVKDFSTIDKDHNVIWRMQGGTVGKATGILPKEEERAYLNSK